MNSIIAPHAKVVPAIRSYHCPPLYLFVDLSIYLFVHYPLPLCIYFCLRSDTLSVIGTSLNGNPGPTDSYDRIQNKFCI